MRLGTLGEARTAAESRRRGPGGAISIPANGRCARLDGSGGSGAERRPGPPAELWIEPTEADGEIAGWFHDEWWADILGQWGEEPLTVHFEPTPGAIVDPVVLSTAEMIRRVAPRWRVVAHAYADEVCYDEAIEQLARSPFHELRLIDERRPEPADVSADAGERDEAPVRSIPIEELMGRIRRVQVGQGRAQPILVRVAALHRVLEHRPDSVEATEPTTRRAAQSA